MTYTLRLPRVLYGRTLFTTLLFASPLAAAAGDVDSFQPLASVGVEGGIAEIVSATGDGMSLVFTDASAERIGVVDISDPSAPALAGEVALAGEPTSVAVRGNLAVAAVALNGPSEGAPPPAFGPSEVVVIDVSDPANPTTLGSIPIGYQPDSIQLTEIGGQLVAVVAIENQPVVVDANGLVTDDEDPGDPGDISPAGLVQVILVNAADPALSTVIDVEFPEADMAAAGLLFPADPQPEYVSIQGTTVAVSLQENNGIAVLDLADPSNPTVTQLFSTGSPSSRNADLTEDGRFLLQELYPDAVGTQAHPQPEDAAGNPIPAGARMPDAIALHPDGMTIYSADEGELNYTGGRGFSVWSTSGAFVWDDGGFLERRAVRRGHYPEGRSSNKGIECEGVTIATFAQKTFAFVLSERGSFMAVYDVTVATDPQFVQIVATGISPEGVVAIPSRDLVVTADEESGTLSIFQGVSGPWVPSPNAPALLSASPTRTFAAISGLALAGPGMLWGVPDNATVTEIYRIDVGQPIATVTSTMRLTKGGNFAFYDCEGVARDTSILADPVNPGLWLATEGNGSSRPNLLVQVDGAGNVMREIQLPRSIDKAVDPTIPGVPSGTAANNRTIRGNGFEGVCVSANGRFLVACIQRDFEDEFSMTKYTRIARYDLEQLQAANPPVSGLRAGGDWDFFFYEMDSDDEDNWAGLSEIITTGMGQFSVIERDKGIGTGSELKKIYSISLLGLTPDSDGIPDSTDTVTKTLEHDILDLFFPYEKVEGLALMPNGDLWVGLDNDGGEVEPRLVRIPAGTDR